MLLFTTLLEHDAAGEPAPTLILSLNHEQRRQARLRVTLPDGSSVGLMLQRGLALKDGDRLRSEDGSLVARIEAAVEAISRASTRDLHLLARAAYHLGNRHVALELGADFLAYPRDHVLDGLCRELGLTVTHALAPFEPESGGYAGEHRHERRLAPLHHD